MQIWITICSPSASCKQSCLDRNHLLWNEATSNETLFSRCNLFRTHRIFLPRISTPLEGATIKRDQSTGAIVVARVMRGGAAHKSGKLRLTFMKCQWHMLDSPSPPNLNLFCTAGLTPKLLVFQCTKKSGIQTATKYTNKWEMKRG